MTSIVRAVMFFVEEPKVVASWWAELLECPQGNVFFADDFVWFDTGEIEFGFHPSDAEKNPLGGSPVVYLRVDDFLAQLLKLSRKARAYTEARS